MKKQEFIERYQVMWHFSAANKHLDEQFKIDVNQLIEDEIAEYEHKKASKVELIETNDGKWFQENLNGYLGEGWEIVTVNIYQHPFGTNYSALIKYPQGGGK